MDKIFDWRAFLNKDKLTYLDWAKMQTLGSSWAKCPVGVFGQSLIKLDEKGRPEDKELLNLGYSFFGNIMARNIKNLKILLDNIEIRCQTLIALNNKKK